MDKVIFVEIETLSGMETHAIIDHGNDQFTSMPKSTYDVLKAAYDESKANEAKIK